MNVGERWAYREKAHTHGHPVLQVEILQFGPPRRHKVRVRFIDGEYPGLDMWVPQVRLRVPWSEAEALLRDERSLIAAWEASDISRESLEYRAASEVFYAYPRPNGMLMGWGSYEWSLVRVENIEAAASDLGLEKSDLLAEPFAFVDRFGVYFAPWPVAYTLARRVAVVFAEQVLADIGKEERELQEGTHGGRYVRFGREEYYHTPAYCADQLHERQPLYDLIRE